MLPKASPTLLQAIPGSGEKNHLDGNSTKEKRNSPWSPGDGLVVVVGPQVGLLAGPGVGEHADLKVGLPKRVRPHQGHHLGHSCSICEY